MPALPAGSHQPPPPLPPAPYPHPPSAPPAAPTPVTDRMVETVMTSTILDLEEHLIPAQGEDDILYVYVGDIVVTHDIRRTLEVFDGDVGEAVTSICRFVVDGIVGDQAR